VVSMLLSSIAHESPRVLSKIRRATPAQVSLSPFWSPLVVEPGPLLQCAVGNSAK
jgi:hypothetical protein